MEAILIMGVAKIYLNICKCYLNDYKQFFGFASELCLVYILFFAPKEYKMVGFEEKLTERI